MIVDRDTDTSLPAELYEDNTIIQFWDSKQYNTDIGFRE